MTRKIFAFIALPLALSLVLGSSAYSDTESFDAGGRWLIKGVGHVDKGFIRSSLEIEGYINLNTSSGEYANMLESYEAYIRIDATTLGIKIYDEYTSEKVNNPVPIPKRIPTASYPIELPTVTYNDLTYDATITGSNSGTLTIQGIVKNVSVIGDLELDSDCKMWRQGTEEPAIDTGKSSGCNSGIVTGIFAALLVFMGVRKRVRN